MQVSKLKRPKKKGEPFLGQGSGSPKLNDVFGMSPYARVDMGILITNIWE